MKRQQSVQKALPIWQNIVWRGYCVLEQSDEGRHWIADNTMGQIDRVCPEVLYIQSFLDDVLDAVLAEVVIIPKRSGL